MALTYDQLTAITQKYIIPKLVDNIFKSNLLLLRLKQKGIRYTGGEKIKQPIVYANVSQAGYYEGYDILPTQMDNVITAAEFEWKQAQAPISISGKEMLQNAGPEAILSLLEAKKDIAELSLMDQLGSGLFSDGSDPKSIDGLKLLLSTSSTYGGISPSDCAVWVAQIDSITNTLSLIAMQKMWGKCTVGADHPTLILTTQSGFDKFWYLNQTDGRLQAPVHEGLAQQGFSNILFNGAPVGVDSHCPGTAGGGANDTYFCFLNERYLWLVTHKDKNFVVDPFQKPVNQDAQVSHILWAGNLVCSNRRMQGALTAINPVQTN